MNSIVIADSRDTCLGLELAGIKGLYLRDAESIEKAFKKVFSDPDTGIIFLSEKAYNLIEETVTLARKKQLFPLITVIPDRHGYQDLKNQNPVTRYIRESVGL